MLRAPSLLSLLSVLAGCGPDAAPPAAGPEEAIVQEKERGPVKVRLRVEPREPTFAERVRFTMEVTASKGVEVTLPPPGENLGEFIIRDYDAPPEKATAEAVEHRRTHVLEFLTSGEYRIPPLTVSFVDRRPAGAGGIPPGGVAAGGGAASGEAAGDASPPPAGGAEPPTPPEPARYSIVTDEITVRVKPLADAESLKELDPIAPPAEPPPVAAGLAWPLGAAGGLAGASLAAWLLARALRRPARAAPPPPPHQRAYAELEWLLGQDYLDRGDLKEFFFHLSRILREYIENRFGLRAPERTTEEFLAELSGLPSRDSGPPFPRHHRGLLREFLERADLVKFARYRPAREEIEASFESAKRFIAETAGLAAEAAPHDVSPAGREAEEARV